MVQSLSATRGLHSLVCFLIQYFIYIFQILTVRTSSLLQRQRHKNNFTFSMLSTRISCKPTVQGGLLNYVFYYSSLCPRLGQLRSARLSPCFITTIIISCSVIKSVIAQKQRKRVVTSCGFPLYNGLHFKVTLHLAELLHTPLPTERGMFFYGTFTSYLFQNYLHITPSSSKLPLSLRLC
jgi:hypothetical protein